ncbi:MAG: hypothetical protein ABSE46_23350 [Terracidiphilus sp.]|jgi:hypothetical protein
MKLFGRDRNTVSALLILSVVGFGIGTGLCGVSLVTIFALDSIRSHSHPSTVFTVLMMPLSALGGLGAVLVPISALGILILFPIWLIQIITRRGADRQQH